MLFLFLFEILGSPPTRIIYHSLVAPLSAYIRPTHFHSFPPVSLPWWDVVYLKSQLNFAAVPETAYLSSLETAPRELSQVGQGRGGSSTRQVNDDEATKTSRSTGKRRSAGMEVWDTGVAWSFPGKAPSVWVENFNQRELISADCHRGTLLEYHYECNRKRVRASHNPPVKIAHI